MRARVGVDINMYLVLIILSYISDSSGNGMFDVFVKCLTVCMSGLSVRLSLSLSLSLSLCLSLTLPLIITIFVLSYSSSSMLIIISLK